MLRRRKQCSAERIAALKRLAYLLVAGVTTGMACAQSPSGSWLSFSLERPAGAPVHYTIRVEQESGNGFYRNDAAVPAGSTAVQGNTPGAAGRAERPIVVESATVKKMFAAVPLVKSNRCDAHNKNVAQTGVKTLRYTSDASAYECTYNYALDDRVNNATALFEAVAETLQYGDRLASKLRFDRLGLDAEIDNLQNALNEGRALGVVNIAPVLQAIEGDERVMERVRRKATHLLQSASGATTQATGERDSSAR